MIARTATSCDNWAIMRPRCSALLVALTQTPVPAGSSRPRFVFEGIGTDIGAFGDDFFAQVESGPARSGWFARGDADHNGRLALAAAVGILLRLYGEGAPTVGCLDCR